MKRQRFFKIANLLSRRTQEANNTTRVREPDQVQNAIKIGLSKKRLVETFESLYTPHYFEISVMYLLIYDQNRQSKSSIIEFQPLNLT